MTPQGPRGECGSQGRSLCWDEGLKPLGRTTAGTKGCSSVSAAAPVYASWEAGWLCVGDEALLGLGLETALLSEEQLPAAMDGYFALPVCWLANKAEPPRAERDSAVAL